MIHSPLLALTCREGDFDWTQFSIKEDVEERILTPHT